MIFKKDLINAIEQTRSNGIHVKDFIIESTSYPIINKENKKELQALFDEHVYSLPFDQIHTQCILHSWNLQDLIAEILNCDILPTFGYLVSESHRWFYTDEQEILQWCEFPNTLRRNIHAWLTLPSLEIIDITLLATIKAMTKQQNPSDNYKVFLNWRPNDYYGVPDRIYHYPQFVDNEFLERVHLLKYDDISPPENVF